jgi:hypothetical protein
MDPSGIPVSTGEEEKKNLQVKMTKSCQDRKGKGLEQASNGQTGTGN